MKKENNNGGIIVQAGILAAASIVVRIIGLLYRSPLTAVIGDEGNGYYGYAFNIYSIILMVSSYSIPSAISKLMAQKLALGEYRNAQRVFYCTMAYALTVGAAFSLFVWFGAGLLVPPRSVPVLRVLAPTIFIFAILGVLRGYFQANQTMVQTSISQILEQIVNAAVSIGAAWFFMHRLAAGQDVHEQAVYGAMGSALGTGSGVMTALIFMAVMYLVNRRYFMKRIRRDRTSRDDPWTGIMRDTILVITPFILSGFILNLTTTVNQTIFSKIMIGAKGLDEIDITTAYGIFSNKAVVITNIPISIATAVAAAIIPNISSAYARKDKEETRRRVIAAVRITNIIATPCALGLIALARPVTMVLFPQWESLGLASALLALLGVTVIFYSIATIMNAALQSIGRMQMPLVSAGIALVVQTLVLVVLLFATNMGVFALVLVSVLYSLMIFLLDSYFLQRYLKLDMDLYNVYARPLFAAVIMGVAAYGLYTMFEVFLELMGSRSLYLNNLIAMVPAILAAVLIYFFALIRMGTLSEEDILGLPKGSMLLKIFRKLKWMKG
ncbi:MAG TPA: polysaccharide biosynthesis protein [Lachnospiraceae bacterium]|nr:polysaccharide biosynthesis protein [Lachnospiraceae bacterium]